MGSYWGSSKEEIEAEIKKTLNELRELGLIEVVGFDNDGLEKYAITELGKIALDIAPDKSWS